MFKLRKSNGLSHDPMDNNVKKTSMFCDNCQIWRIAVLRKGEIWNYYQLMIWGKLSIKKASNSEELKKRIKDLGVEVSQEEAETIRDYVYLKSPTVPDAIKKIYLLARRGKIGFRASKRNPWICKKGGIQKGYERRINKEMRVNFLSFLAGF